MSFTAGHLSIEELSSNAMDIIKEIGDLLLKVDLGDMGSILTAGQETTNLYYYKPTHALFNIVQWLVKEMLFIVKKVIVFLSESHLTNRNRTQYQGITVSACLLASLGQLVYLRARRI
jgi:hypothetical protein